MSSQPPALRVLSLGGGSQSCATGAASSTSMASSTSTEAWRRWPKPTCGPEPRSSPTPATRRCGTTTSWPWTAKPAFAYLTASQPGARVANGSSDLAQPPRHRGASTQIAHTENHHKVCTVPPVRRTGGAVPFIVTPMLSIAKLRIGQEAYTISGVAQSLDDYYTGAGEAPGRWMGTGAVRLGLDGEVDPDDLRAVLAGIAPGTGGTDPNGDTIRPRRSRVPGFDLTFKAPKSVSVLYAVSDDPRVQGHIIEAGESALAETLAWLEREVIAVRRGTGNQRHLADLASRDPEAAEAARIHVLPGGELVAAAFRHRTSRAGDPLLHWHTLVANVVRGVDGRWSAPLHPRLYGSAKAAGEVYQAVLRQELTTRLGVQWRPGRHVREVAGVPQALCDQFSKRSAEIDAWMAQTGTADGPAGRQAAVLATRRGKPEVEDRALDAGWKAEAIEFGWGPEQADQLVASLTPTATAPTEELWELPDRPRPWRQPQKVSSDEWISDLVSTELGTDQATVTRAELTALIAARLGNGADVTTIEQATARVLVSGQLVAVDAPDQDRWSPAHLVAAERRLLTAFRTPRRHLDQDLVDATLTSWPSLGTDQAQAVRTLATAPRAVVALVGPAGTGKTYTLDAMRLVFESAGYTVIGAAPSARGAEELQLDAHVAAGTLHRLIKQWDGGYRPSPDASTVLFVDEAAMASTVSLEPVVSRVVNAGGRVVLAGDHHQLPEVEAGGGFAAAINTTIAAELTVNRRQRHAWEQRALAELRDGAVPDAVRAYLDHGRVHVVTDRPEMIRAGIDAWLDARDSGLDPVLIAGTNEMVRALNQALRNELRHRGELGAEVATSVYGREMLLGERIVCRTNAWLRQPDGTVIEVFNGHTGTVIGATDGWLWMHRDHDGRHVALDRVYTGAGRVDYAYAATTHRVQGGTWDVAIGVGIDGLHREAAYTLLSRARHHNILVITQPELTDLDAELGRHDRGLPLPGELPDDLDEYLNRRFTRSAAKTLALGLDPDADRVAALAQRYDLRALDLRAGYARHVEREATRNVGTDPTGLAAQVARGDHTARHIVVGQHVKAHDRDNIGMVVSIDDTTGTAGIRFVSVTGREAHRQLRWDQIEIVTPSAPPPRTLSAELAERLAQEQDRVEATVERWEDHLRRHGIEPGDAQRCERAAQALVAHAYDRTVATAPAWITETLGTRPTTPAEAQVYDDALRAIVTWRLQAHVHDRIDGIGPRPVDSEFAARWDALAATTVNARRWLATHDPEPQERHPRTAVELTDRLDKLDAILTTAPDDLRDLIPALRAGHMLPFDDLAQVLDDALASVGARRDWILEHWPHVVEHAEITRQLVHAEAHADLDETKPVQLAFIVGSEIEM